MKCKQLFKRFLIDLKLMRHSKTFLSGNYDLRFEINEVNWNHKIEKQEKILSAVL